ncbi:hypothetical protein ACJ72_00072 [Emergomyces africanus]|uniref:Uncharacterized protein n=1 Tax=Emergomyces africanus TaxID=1955775 RepID=A0A1B7P911_9EURO|nr:hypothetical protein ACJ72_00072 [Emergomyces africanus]
MSQNTYHPPPHQNNPSLGRESTFTTSADRGTTEGKTTASDVGHGVKSTLAGVHGLGETIRGSANAAVDRGMKDPEGVRKNEAIAREGEREVETGQFSQTTKAREGGHEYDRM